MLFHVLRSLRRFAVKYFRMRAKTVVGLCVFIAAVHLSLIVVLQGQVLADLGAEFKVKVYSDGSEGGHRVKRGAEADIPSLSGRHILQEEDSDQGLQMEEVVTVSPQAQCRTGHVQALRPVCAFGCLRRLYVGNPSFDPPRAEVVPTDIRREIVSMPGKLHNVHISLISHVTDMQWSNGIYGTIGEIGAYEGQLTKVLAYNIDTEAGERLFVSDHFQNDATSKPKDRLQSVFEENVKAVEFHVDSPSEENRLFLHVGQPRDLGADLLQQMDLPQFRLLSINGDQDAMSILMSLERAICMLRDGGVIIVSGIHSRNSQATTALKHFFHRHGTHAFMPFVATRDRVYLTTTNWKDRAQRYFTDNSRLALIFNLQATTTNAFGPEMVYLTQKR